MAFDIHGEDIAAHNKAFMTASGNTSAPSATFEENIALTTLQAQTTRAFEPEGEDIVKHNAEFIPL